MTSSGKIVIGGKSAEQNEEIIRRVSADSVIMHTASPGSPFCIIRNPNLQDIREVAVFCACFSQQWKKDRKKTEVHIFKGEQVIKNRGMKIGTFGILGSVNKRKVELKLVLDIQRTKLRAVPPQSAKKKLATLTPGKSDKSEAADKIKKILKEKYCYPVTKEEIMSAIPSGCMSVK